MEVRKLTAGIGAEIIGVDLAREPDAAKSRAIREAWLEHCVIFFREQALSPAQFMAFAHSLGTPVEYPLIKGLPEFPCITPVIKLEHERHNFGGIWHSDTTYLDAPPMGTLLLAREVPPVGGDTLFANQYLAFESLSDGLKRTLAGLTGIASSAKADVTRTREDRLKTDGRDDARKEYSAEHPVVRTHPETGRQALYVNIGHTVRFKDWTEAESAPLLNFLFQHQIQSEFTCRFAWRVGSIALW
ncbi:MAG TPA: TauD/TfdA family dioxygenase, partial [Burkholderiales bacterium]|nr:TauD/TfdA family dioxygenase [Burkholderiales bacterium]